jgi:hypothetical protein
MWSSPEVDGRHPTRQRDPTSRRVGESERGWSSECPAEENDVVKRRKTEGHEKQVKMQGEKGADSSPTGVASRPVGDEALFAPRVTCQRDLPVRTSESMSSAESEDPCETAKSKEGRKRALQVERLLAAPYDRPLRQRRTGLSSLSER